MLLRIAASNASKIVLPVLEHRPTVLLAQLQHWALPSSLKITLVFKIVQLVCTSIPLTTHAFHVTSGAWPAWVLAWISANPAETILIQIIPPISPSTTLPLEIAFVVWLVQLDSTFVSAIQITANSVVSNALGAWLLQPTVLRPISVRLDTSSTVRPIVVWLPVLTATTRIVQRDIASYALEGVVSALLATSTAALLAKLIPIPLTIITKKYTCLHASPTVSMGSTKCWVTIPASPAILLVSSATYPRLTASSVKMSQVRSITTFLRNALSPVLTACMAKTQTIPAWAAMLPVHCASAQQPFSALRVVPIILLELITTSPMPLLTA